MRNKKNNNSVTVKAALITATAVVVAALIAGGFSILNNQGSPGSTLTQTVNSNGIGVINTGKGNVDVDSKD